MIDKDHLSYLSKLKEMIDSCPKCHGTDMGCSCYKNYYREAGKISANIPLKFRGFSMSSIAVKKSSMIILNKIKKYIQTIDEHKKRGIGLYLWGNTGSGKTMLSAIVLMSALEKGYSGYFITVQQYLEKLRDKTDESRNFLKGIADVEFLVIDDLGREYWDDKGYIESQLGELLRHRADRLLPTIITSNKSIQNLLTKTNAVSLMREQYIDMEFLLSDYRKELTKEVAYEKKEITSEKPEENS